MSCRIAISRSAAKIAPRGKTGVGRDARGFTLLEMMIAMAIGLVVLGAAYSVFTIQYKTFGNQEEIVAMQQGVRAGMDMMAREVGWRGTSVRGEFRCEYGNDFAGVVIDATQSEIRADLNGDGAIDGTSEENIVYAFDSANHQITRTSAAAPSRSSERGFSFDYLTAPARPRSMRGCPCDQNHDHRPDVSLIRPIPPTAVTGRTPVVVVTAILPSERQEVSAWRSLSSAGSAAVR